MTFIVMLEIHIRQRFARGRFPVQRLTCDALAALQRIAGMLVDNIARIVQNNRVRKPLPDKLPVAEFDTAAFIGHAFRQVYSIVRHAAKQQCCNQDHLGHSRAHHS